MLDVWKKRLIQFWWGWGCAMLVAALIATSFRSAVADWNDVPSGSMKPTILEGDRIFVNRLAYDLKIPFTTWHVAQWDNPKRGEIVVFFSPKDGMRLVKRVIGLPGDTIAMVKNQLLINGQPLQYDESPDQPAIHYLATDERSESRFFTENLLGVKHLVMFMPSRPSFNTFPPIVVPEGKYFMMGDNRDDSADSRYFGFVERWRIVGRATAVALSLDYDHHYAPRWDRFGYRLP